jgi:hypothetical protein
MICPFPGRYRPTCVCKHISLVSTKLSSIKCVEEIAELSLNVYSATGCNVFLPLFKRERKSTYKVRVMRVTTIIRASYISFKNLLVIVEMNPSYDGG